jgi:hypothetical protein
MFWCHPKRFEYKGIFAAGAGFLEALSGPRPRPQSKIKRDGREIGRKR